MKKVDENGAPLAGVKFQVFNNAACTDPNLELGALTTDPQGLATWKVSSEAENPPPDTYHIKEISAPDPYVVNNTPYSVTVTYEHETAADALASPKIVSGGPMRRNKTTKTLSLIPKVVQNKAKALKECSHNAIPHFQSLIIKGGCLVENSHINKAKVEQTHCG